MERIGYALVNLEKKILVQSWWTDSPIPPNMYKIPGTDLVCLGDKLLGQVHHGHKLVKYFRDASPPSIWHGKIDEELNYDGEKMITKYIYSQEPNIVPDVLKAIQFRKALREMKLLDMFKRYINDNKDNEIYDYFEYSVSFQRNSLEITGLILSLNISKEQMDELFRLGSNL